MDKIVRQGITQVLINHRDLLKIPLRHKAKFEGWLKFELAHYLEEIGMENVKVESKASFSRDRADITFFHNGEPHTIEMKTPNTNWKIKGVNSNCRPITKNIQSIIDDTKKLNSSNGICAFVLFPIPVGDNRWESYLYRISEKTGIALSREKNCNLIKVAVDSKNECNLMVCTFMSKRFSKFLCF